MLQGLVDFLFGKAPDIFDAEGNVVHKLPAEKWQKWNERFKKKEYDWHAHTGTERRVQTAPKKN